MGVVPRAYWAELGVELKGDDFVAKQAEQQTFVEPGGQAPVDLYKLPARLDYMEGVADAAEQNLPHFVSKTVDINSTNAGSHIPELQVRYCYDVDEQCLITDPTVTGGPWREYQMDPALGPTDIDFGSREFRVSYQDLGTTPEEGREILKQGSNVQTVYFWARDEAGNVARDVFEFVLHVVWPKPTVTGCHRPEPLPTTIAQVYNRIVNGAFIHEAMEIEYHNLDLRPGSWAPSNRVMLHINKPAYRARVAGVALLGQPLLAGFDPFPPGRCGPYEWYSTEPDYACQGDASRGIPSSIAQAISHGFYYPLFPGLEHGVHAQEGCRAGYPHNLYYGIYTGPPELCTPALAAAGPTWSVPAGLTINPQEGDAPQFIGGDTYELLPGTRFTLDVASSRLSLVATDPDMFVPKEIFGVTHYRFGPLVTVFRNQSGTFWPLPSEVAHMVGHFVFEAEGAQLSASNPDIVGAELSPEQSCNVAQTFEVLPW